MIGYFAALNLLYIVFTALAWRSITRYLRSLEYAAIEEALASPMTPPVSILLPAYNEEAGVVQSVAALLQLRYPEFEVIVVNDGSKDATLERLTRGLRPRRRAARAARHGRARRRSARRSARRATPSCSWSTRRTAARRTR